MNDWMPPNDATLIGFACSVWSQAKKACVNHICFFSFRGRLITCADDAQKVHEILRVPTGKDSKGRLFTILAINDDLNDRFNDLRLAGQRIAIAELKDGHQPEPLRQMELFGETHATKA